MRRLGRLRLSGGVRPSLITLADRARDAGQWDLAAKYYRRSLDRNPRNSPIWVQYGHALKESGHLAEAEATYRRALADAPEVTDGHLQLGRVLKLQGKIEEAKAAYLGALLMFNRLSAEARRELADLGYSESELPESIHRTFVHSGKPPLIEPSSPMGDGSGTENAFRDWRPGIAAEREFWSGFLGTRGGPWDSFPHRIDPEAHLFPHLIDILQNTARSGSNHLRILDVGAGPLSGIGKKMPGATLEIVATDPLADIYDALLEKYQITPPVRTQFGVAEDLSIFFRPSSFDLVHCSNALDHSLEPMRGIIEMLRVVKVNRAVVLAHFRNEGEFENYSGFHQHNFDIIDQKFVIWNNTRRITVDDSLPIACEIVNTFEATSESTVAVRGNIGIVKTVIIKRAEFEDNYDNKRRDKRMQTIYRQMISALASVDQ